MAHEANNCVAFLDFPIIQVMGLNESNSDSETVVLVVMLKKMDPLIYRSLLQNASLLEKVFLGRKALCDGPGRCNATVWPLH